MPRSPVAGLLFMALAAALCGEGCHQKKESPAFTHASQAFSKLYGQELDNAYLDPKLNDIEAELKTVPDDSLDASAAQALLSRINEGRTRMQAEAEERAKTAALADTPVVSFPFQGGDNGRPSSAGALAATRDGGAPSAAHPTAGMSMEEFNRRFGECFGPNGPVNVTGSGLRDSYALKDLQFCRDAHPGLDQVIFLSDGVTLVGSFPKSALVTVKTYEDGGRAP